MPPSRNQPAWRRHLPELAVAALGLLIVVGLWWSNRSDGGSDDAGTARTELSTTTTAAATGGTTPLIQDESRSIEGDAGAARSLQDAVLKASDLGSGWSPTGQSSGPSPLCQQRDPVAGSPTAVVRSGYVRNPGTRLMAGSVAQYKTAGVAQQVLQQVGEDTRACSTSTVSFTVEALPGVGDEALRIASTVNIAGSKIRSAALLARQGARIAVVTATGDPVDDDLVLKALKAEVSRL
jgi:hypothetical protein